MKKLNLGCGYDFKKGYDNYDKEVDLNEKLPFPDNYADEILLSHVLEHVQDVFFTLNECHRVLKKHGKLFLIVPHFTNNFAYIPEHKHYFSVHWFLCKTDKTRTGSRERMPFKLLTVKLGGMFSFIANINPYIWENYLKYVFPVRHIEVVYEKKKLRRTDEG